MSLRARVVPLVAAACVAAMLLPAPGSAQTPDSARSRLRVRAAFGMDAMLYDGNQSTPSLYALTGVEWLHPRAPFSARLDLSYFRRDRDLGDRRSCVEYCVYGFRHEVVGLSLDGRYTFLGAAAVRPYLLSGFGIYHSMHTNDANYVCDDFSCTSTPGERGTFRYTSTGLGLHAGVGFAFPIRRSELSLEFRLVQHMPERGRSRNMPVLLGIRF